MSGTLFTRPIPRRTHQPAPDRVQFLSVFVSGVDVEGVKTRIPEQSLMFVSRRTPGNHEMSFRAKRGISLCVEWFSEQGPGRDSSRSLP